jgi:hypothetical protein
MAVFEEMKIGGTQVVDRFAFIPDHHIDDNKIGVGLEQRNWPDGVL